MPDRKTLLAAVALMTAMVPAAAADKPLFDAMQKYCVATDSDFDAVVALATEDRGVPVKIDTKFGPGQRMQAFDIATPTDSDARRRLTVTISDSEGGSKTPAGTRATMCSVLSFAVADDSEAAFVEWVGVPPATRRSEKGIVSYDFAFQQKDGKHVQAPFDGDGLNEAIKNGGVWKTSVMFSSKVGLLIYAHFVVPQAPTKPQ